MGCMQAAPCPRRCSLHIHRRRAADHHISFTFSHFSVSAALLLAGCRHGHAQSRTQAAQAGRCSVRRTSSGELTSSAVTSASCWPVRSLTKLLSLNPMCAPACRPSSEESDVIETIPPCALSHLCGRNQLATPAINPTR
jgi:hypothetical protein